MNIITVRRLASATAEFTARSLFNYPANQQITKEILDKDSKVCHTEHSSY